MHKLGVPCSGRVARVSSEGITDSDHGLARDRDDAHGLPRARVERQGRTRLAANGLLGLRR